MRAYFGVFAIAFAFASCKPKAPPPPAPSPEKQIAASEWCRELDRGIAGQGWRSIPKCAPGRWRFDAVSVKGRPLMVAELGKMDSPNTTLILGMVHSDEITPLYLVLKLVDWLEKHPEELSSARVILAPLVNPDSFFSNPKKRVNANGVDVNRNLPTPDWEKDALRLWKTKFRREPRRFPGTSPNSEPETRFQVELIRKYAPKKILSIHAPLNFLDYDGPDALQLGEFPSHYAKRSLELRSALKAKSHGFFPGSLGNYAGETLGIPTLTLELPSANARKADEYWKLFEGGIRTMIRFEMIDSQARN